MCASPPSSGPSLSLRCGRWEGSRGTCSGPNTVSRGSTASPDTDLLDNFTAASPVMGQDKLPAPRWRSRLPGRTGSSRSATVCVFARGSALHHVSYLSAIIIFYTSLLPPCLTTILWGPFSLLSRPPNFQSSLCRVFFSQHFPVILQILWLLHPFIFILFLHFLSPPYQWGAQLNIHQLHWFYSCRLVMFSFCNSRSKLYQSLIQTFSKYNLHFIKEKKTIQQSTEKCNLQQNERWCIWMHYDFIKNKTFEMHIFTYS